MATNAEGGGLRGREYPVTTPRDWSRRTRDWDGADTDKPAVAASWAHVARPSATSSRAGGGVRRIHPLPHCIRAVRRPPARKTRGQTSSTRKSHHHDQRSDITASDGRGTCATLAIDACTPSAHAPNSVSPAPTGCPPARPSPGTCFSPSQRPHRSRPSGHSRSGAGVYDVAHDTGARARRAGGPAR